MTRVPDLGELADDVVDLRREVRMLTDAISRDYVRADLHNEQIGSVRADIAKLDSSTAAGIAGVKTIQMWMLGILGSIFVAVVVAVVTVGVGR